MDFENEGTKDINLILTEININSIFKDNIKQKLNEIKNIYNYSYKKFNKEEIINEIDLIKNNLEKNITNIIASMIRVVEIEFHFIIRDVQIISLLICLLESNKKGLIEEIKTGEGKTIIIAFLAVIYCLKGKKVDILTSSSVLAERDSLNLKIFYSYYSLTTDYCRVQKTINGKYNNFSFYNVNICYGDSLSFEGDILRSQFLKEVGRGERPFDCIIVDEIDNLCIDNLKNQTELLDNFPGYKFLDFFYLYIYNSLIQIVNEYKETDLIDEINKIDKNRIINELEKKIRNFLIKNKNESEEKKIYYPSNLEDFIENRINGWCRSAFYAMFDFKVDKNYIITKDENNNLIIQPIDYLNTGTVQQNSVWSGLHQFLQIKHGLRLTGENLNSCFLSNLIFFDLYKTLNGFTGTLGSAKTQEAITEIYKINLIKIPTFKKSKFENLTNININEKNNYENILLDAIEKFAVKENRAVLLIFEYIFDAQNFYNLFTKKLQNSGLKLILYLRNDKEEEKKFLNTSIQPRTVIFSTNLAGRGTDIKINNNLEKNGGLHVIITFMPRNKRIECQAFGRAARKGERGSGQIIMQTEYSYEDLLKLQENEEEDEFNYLINLYTPKIKLFHHYFDIFCQKLKKVKSKNVSEYIINDIREQWSLFVFNNKKDDIEKSKTKINYSQQFQLEKRLLEDNFNEFISKVFPLDYNNYNYKNPFIVTKNISTFEVLDNAIKISSKITLGAYYIKSFSLINKKVHDYKRMTIDTLYTLKDLTEHFINQFNTYLNLIDNINKNNNSNNRLDLKFQTIDKRSLMEDLYNNINENINKIENVQKKNTEYNVFYLNNGYINNNYSSHNITNDDDFEINISKIKKFNEIDRAINKDILDYFIDYGICLFFDIECKEIPCYRKVINYIPFMK
jgi:preprotein translocase subunit SecA